MGHVFIFVKWEDDWNWEQFRIFQASWVFQWQMVEPCSCPPAKNTHCSTWRKKRCSGGTETLTNVCGETAGHRDGVQSRWNKPTALRVHRNTVFVCDTGNKAVRMLTSSKGLIPLQSKGRVALWPYFFYVASQVVPQICRDIYTTRVIGVARARHKWYLKPGSKPALNISPWKVRQIYNFVDMRLVLVLLATFLQSLFNLYKTIIYNTIIYLHFLLK